MQSQRDSVVYCATILIVALICITSANAEETSDQSVQGFERKSRFKVQINKAE